MADQHSPADASGEPPWMHHPDCEGRIAQLEADVTRLREALDSRRVELARLRAIEEAAAWHLNHSACAGWQQGEVLALALGVNPETPNQEFTRLLDALGIPHDGPDPLAALLDDDPAEGEPT